MAMVKEFTRIPERYGIILRDQVRERISYVADHHLTPGKPKYFVARTLLNHLDELDPTLWRTPRSTTEVNSITADSYGAFHFAFRSRAWKDLYDPAAGLAKEEDYERAWSETFSQEDYQRLFTDRFWDQPTSFAPSRVPPFYHIIRDFYEKPENQRPLAIVDLGAGPAYTIRTLNSSRALVGDIEGKDILFGRATELPIAFGISVDKDSSDNAIYKARLNTEDPSIGEQLRNFRKNLYKGRQFLDLVCDIAGNADGCYERITSWLNRETGSVNADVIISSFLRYQLKSDIKTQSDYWQLITQFLREGGILIEVGNELLTPRPDLRYKVHVYQKKDGKLEHIGVPFVIADDGKVLEINLDYFE